MARMIHAAMKSCFICFGLTPTPLQRRGARVFWLYFIYCFENDQCYNTNSIIVHSLSHFLLSSQCYTLLRSSQLIYNFFFRFGCIGIPDQYILAAFAADAEK